MSPRRANAEHVARPIPIYAPVTATTRDEIDRPFEWELIPKIVARVTRLSSLAMHCFSRVALHVNGIDLIHLATYSMGIFSHNAWSEPIPPADFQLAGLQRHERKRL